MEAASGFLSYQWNNGKNNRIIQVNKSGSYSVKVTEASGCTSYSLPIPVSIKENKETPQICGVSVDSKINKNKIYFKLNFDYGASYYKIFKEINEGELKIIDTVNYKRYSQIYVDYSSNPAEKPAKYYISLVDTCGTESLLSIGHKTLHLKFYSKQKYTILEWEPYEGMDVAFYYIFRGLNPDNLKLLDSVPSTILEYSDFNPNQKFYYQIRIVKNNFCYLGSEYMSSINSNVAPQLKVGMEESVSFPISIDIYPNPNKGVVNVNVQLEMISDCSIKIRNITGNLVYELKKDHCKEFIQEVDLNGQSPGVYYLEMQTQNERLVKKLVILE